MDKTAKVPDDAFVPVGAIAFFVVLALFLASVWLAFYALMIYRQIG